MNEDDEDIVSLKESIDELKEEYAALYDRLPVEQRVQFQAQTQEYDRRLNRLAQSKGFYNSDKSSYEALRRNGKRFLIGAFAVLAVIGFAREWNVFETSLRLELTLFAIVGATGLAHWIEYLLAQKMLAYSARQLSNDEQDLQALGVSFWDRREVDAALHYQNEFLDLDDEEFTHDQKQLHHTHMKLNWRVSAIQDSLTALGIDWP